MITNRQWEIYLTRHHDQGCMPVKQTAELMSISEHTVRRDMAKLEKSNPELFPILTEQQRRVLDRLAAGEVIVHIANVVGVSESRVNKIIAKLKELGVYHKAAPHKTVSYDPNMDGNVKEKF